MSLSAITLPESKRLVELERVIKSGLDTFVEVGEALLEIRDSKLYRVEFKTFEAYCSQKWNMSRPRVYQLIGASETAKRVSTIVDKAPVTESQARPLTKLPPAQQPAAWEKAVESAGGKQPTARQVEAAVDQIVDPVSKPVSVNEHDESDNDSDALWQLKSWWKKAAKKDHKAFLLWVKSRS